MDELKQLGHGVGPVLRIEQCIGQCRLAPKIGRFPQQAAQGVILGTAALITEECPLHPDLKRALIGATELDTMVIMRSIQNSHRVWTNEAAKKVAELERLGAGLAEIVKVAGGEKAKRMYQEGDLNAGVISCGQGIGLVKRIMPMKDLIEGIVQQADGLRKKLAVA